MKGREHNNWHCPWKLPEHLGSRGQSVPGLTALLFFPTKAFSLTQQMYIGLSEGLMLTGAAKLFANKD